jgi:multiple sugar transport system substrate-binding protein
VAEYKKVHPEKDLVIETLPINGYMDKAIAATAAGNPPDLLDLDAVMIASMAGRNLLQPWDDYIKNLDIKDFGAGIWSAGVLNGKTYALPSRNASTVYFYNKTMFDKAGIPYPTSDWTYAEFLEIAQKLTIPGEQYGASIAASLSDPANVMTTFATMLWGFGGDFLDPTNTKCVLDQPNSVAAIKFWTELYTKHKVVPEGSVNYAFTKDIVPMFISNKVALFPGSSSQFTMLNENKDLKWGVVTCPQKYNRGGGWSFTIPAGAKNAEAARTFALWFVEPQNLGRLAIREPSRKSATNVPPWNSDQFKPVFEASAYSKLTPVIPQWTDIQTMVITELQKILLGQKTPEQGAKDMTDQANVILKK